MREGGRDGGREVASSPGSLSVFEEGGWMHSVICGGRREEVKKGAVYMFIWCMCVGGE